MQNGISPHTLSKSHIRVSLYDKISAVPEADWLRFIPASNPLLQPSYLQLLEDTQKGKMEFIYALLHEADAMIGVCYFQIVRFKGTNLVPYFPGGTGKDAWGRMKSAVLGLSKGFVGRLDIPLLVSGNLFITGEQGLYFLPRFTLLQQAAYLSHTIDHILHERPHIKTVLLPDMYEPSGDFDIPFLQHHYQRIFVEADMSMVLDPQWRTFDDYLNAISSKYRVRAKKILQNSNQLSGHEMSADEMKQQEDRFFDLYEQVADKAYFNIAKFTKEYFVAQKRLTPDIYKVFGYYLDGTLVGFMTLFILPHKTEVHFCGIDYSINRDHNLYQRMLYGIVRYAIDHQLKDLHFGRTAPEVKSTIGAIPHPMYGYLFHRNSFYNSFMGLFTGRLKPREYVLRSPFK